MSLTLILSITIRLMAMGWSIVMLRRTRDWRMAFLTAMLGLMATRQTLALLGDCESWAVSVTIQATELPGLMVSIMAFLAVFFMERCLVDRKRTGAALHKVNRALKTLSECNQALVRATRESDLLTEVCRIVVEIGGYRLAWVGFADPDEAKTVRPAAQWGFEEGYLETIHITWDDTEHGQGPTGRAIRTGTPCAAQHILTDPDYEPWRAEATKRGYQSSISLPLRRDGQTFGALSAYASEPDAFDEAEVELLMELADDLAFGIRALRAREEHRKTEEALRKSEQHLRDVLDGLGPYMFVGVMTLDGTLIEANRPALEIAGLKPEDVLGRPFEEAYWWSYSEPVKRHLRESIERAAAGEASRYDVVIRVGEDRFLTIW